MGVKGLWRLVASAGKPVSLESLNGKILAVGENEIYETFFKDEYFLGTCVLPS